MAVEFKPVVLHGRSRDNEGVLVFGGQQLMAVLARLSSIHGAQEGQWFVEATFSEIPTPVDRVFADLDAAEAWARGVEH